MVAFMILISLFPQDCANGLCSPPGRRIVRPAVTPIVRAAAAPIAKPRCQTTRLAPVRRFFSRLRGR